MSINTRVIVPRVQGRLFRLHKRDDVEDRVDEPQRIIFRELTQMKQANEDGRDKGIEHETTALFGSVMQFNIGEDPDNKIFEEILSNDHLEVFYRDIGDPSENKVSTGGILRSFTRHRTLFARPPQFFGPVWKPEHQESSNVVNTKIDAWGYMRLMQYYNIPRGKGKPSYVKLLEMKDVLKNGLPTGKVAARQSGGDIRIHSDLLDYMDHAIELYLGDMHNKTYPTVMNPIKVTQENEDLTVNMESTDLNVKLYTISKKTGANYGIPDNLFTDDYPNITSEITRINSIDSALKIDDLIEDAINGQETIGVFRFMDAKIRLAHAIIDPVTEDPRGRLFRVVGEIVAIDQFGLAKLLTGAIAYDHGIQNWWTPIVEFDADYVTKMMQLLGDLTEDDSTPSVGKLVYVRFRSAELIGNANTIDRRNLQRIAVFNRDSFGEFMNFFSRAPEYNFYTLSKFLNQGLGSGSSSDIQRHPSFLSIAVSLVDFLQSRSVSEYTIFINTTGDDATKDVFELIRKGAALTPDTPPEQIIQSLRTEYLKRSSSYSAFIATALKKDDKFVSFMTNIPASYMRADVFTGSKFKTFSYDSLSIIRVIQILSSTMGGFPATNNPVQTGGGKGTFQNPATKVDNYPVFLANRVIIEPAMIFSTAKTGAKSWKGYQSVTAAADNEQNQILKGWFFIRLKVGIKDQVIDRSKVEFDIPIGDINDLNIVKGAALNHIFSFSFAENMDFLHSLNTAQSQQLIEDKNSIRMIYKLGGQNGEASYGVSPSELNQLTLQDMTQDATYHPLLNRAQVNSGVTPKANSTIELPVHDPILGWAATTNNAAQYPLGVVVMNISDRKNTKVLKSTIVNPSSQLQKDLRKNNRLVGIKNFADISDLIQEIRTLRRLAVEGDFAYSELSSSRSDKTLFELISMKLPFKFDFSDPEIIFKLVADDDPTEQSLKSLLDELAPIENITELDMVWSLPIEGYRLTEATTTLDPKEIGTELVDLENNRNVFVPYMPTYAGVVFLDLLVKGIRYMLWTLSKSRYLASVYLPGDHLKYSKDWETNFAKFLAKTTGNIERNVPIVSVGSSIIFNVERNNVLRRNIDVGSGLQTTVNWFARKFRRNEINFSKKIITGSSSHRLKSFNIDGEDATLIWYVAKKKVYIGKDSGYMMRLNMTEGSFDWTLFYREDTVITRLSEYYLKNGMGNFMVSKGGY